MILLANSRGRPLSRAQGKIGHLGERESPVAGGPGDFANSIVCYGKAFFRGFEPMPAARAALASSRSVEGLRTGQVYRVH
jgi:hypothetical protein